MWGEATEGEGRVGRKGTFQISGAACEVWGELQELFCCTAETWRPQRRGMLQGRHDDEVQERRRSWERCCVVIHRGGRMREEQGKSKPRGWGWWGWAHGAPRVRRGFDIAGWRVPLRPGECVSQGREAAQGWDEAGPSPPLPGPSWLARGPMCTAHLPLPSTWAARPWRLTGAKCFSTAFQTQTWDLYFSSKINILKAVFFLTMKAWGVFNYLREAFLGQADLFTVSLV